MRMEKICIKYKRIAILTIVLVVILVLSCLLNMFADTAHISRYIDADNAGGITQLAINVSYPTDGDLGQLANGNSYVYTDKDKINAFRSGAETEDTSLVLVDTSQSRGSQKNPYVIASTDDWETFVKKISLDSTHGSGKYFILANDLDFEGITFHPVEQFNGNLYGLGFSLKNIVCDQWKYWNGSDYVDIGTSGRTSDGFGLFCKTTDATITDLIIRDFRHIDIPRTSTAQASHGPFNGAIIGSSHGNDNVLNCHVQGETISSLIYSCWNSTGGILGARRGGSSAELLIYRCTANKYNEYSHASGYGPTNGGLIGQIFAGGQVSIFDCAVNSRVKSNSLEFPTSVAIGWLDSVPLVMENIVGTVDIDANSTYPTGGALLSYASSVNGSIKNCFVAGSINNGSVSTSLRAISGTNSPTEAQNINLLKTSSDYAPLRLNNRDVLTTNLVVHSSLDNLTNAAKSNVGAGLLSQIWDAEKIGGMYDPDNSPVRNYLKATVTFRNLLSTGEEELGIETDDYRTNDKLPQPTGSYIKANHEFLGWTDDESGKSQPFETFPAGLLGEVTLYAVWGVPDGSVSASISAIGGAASAVYGDEIKLQSNVSVSVMSHMQYDCQWIKDGANVSGATKHEYSVKNVKQSGKYTLEYTFYSTEEPLWRGKGKTNAFEATITPATLSVEEVTFAEPAYFGRPYGNFTPNAVMKDGKGNVIEGVASWDISMGTIGGIQDSVADGKVTKAFNFVPDAKYEGNYGDGKKTDGSGAYIAYDAVFEIEYLTMTFNMPELGNRKVVVQLEFGRQYTYKKVAELFMEGFDKYLEDPSFEGLFTGQTPAFNVDGKTISINDYKNKPSNAYENVTEAITIEVKFIDAFYTVTFDPANGDDEWQVGNLLYNKPIDEPTKPQNGDYMFMGWYYDTGTIGSDGKPVMKKWDFDDDKITDNLTLEAQWLRADKLISVTVKLAEGKTFLAGSAIEKGDLVVTAEFEGNIGSESIKQNMEISWEDYKDAITYVDSWDGRLHILDKNKPQMTVEVRYTFVTPGGAQTTMSGSVDLTVTPITVYTDKLNFGQDSNNVVTMDYNGEARNIRKLAADEYAGMNIADIRYEYRNSRGQLVQPDEVIAAGEYTVTVIFDMTSNDYKADNKSLKLVVGLVTKVRVEWDKTEFSFNGEIRRPTAKIFREDGTELLLPDSSIEYIGDVDAVKRGDYKITLKLPSSYSIIDGGENCSFSIVKAILDAPTLKSDANIIYDGDEKSIEKYLDGFLPAIMKIESGATGKDARNYTAIISLTHRDDCEWSGTSGNTITLTWKIAKAQLTANWDNDEFIADGKAKEPKLDALVGLANADLEKVNYETDLIYGGDREKSEVGAYVISVSLNDAEWAKNYELTTNIEWAYVIVPKSGLTIITVEWDEEPLEYNGKIQRPNFKIIDKDGNDITDQVKLTFGGDADKSKWAGDYVLNVQVGGNYFIKSGSVCNYTIKLNEKGEGANPDGKEEKPEQSVDFGKVGEILGDWWQVIASVVSIICMIAFLAKTFSFENRRKRAKKINNEKYKTFYAAIGLFGLTMTNWTIIASCLMASALASFVIMLIAKSRCIKAEDELAAGKEEFLRNKDEEERKRRDEEMKMMFMHMLGGNSGGQQGQPQGYAYVQQGLGADEMRGLISETVTALLPGMQQMLPQQASANDELVRKLLDKTAENEETMRELMKKLAEQQSVEKVVEREVAGASVDGETIKQMMKNQELLMQKILELSAQNNASQPQVIEKVIEKPVEKIVEKEVVKEVKVEVPVEKIVEKAVPVAAASKAKKEVASRLTLDEAYEKLSKQQKKFFDGLREYAMKKEKCKEKRSTYNILLGQSTVNPLVKLTIKKDVTVALFKMEDEYLKDIRRNASNDGAKIKVKETEIAIGDAQAYSAAKEMIDLREDQIERYQDFLKEQRALRKS